MKRCRWCGTFVHSSTQPTVRTVLGVVDEVKAWRTFSQVLCPGCSEGWSQNQSWNKAPDPALPIIVR